MIYSLDMYQVCSLAIHCIGGVKVHHLTSLSPPPPPPRYDLHEWLFTLHNGLENFKKKMQKIKQRQQQQQLTKELNQTAGVQQDGNQPHPLEAAGEQQTSSGEGVGPRPRANTAEHIKPSATAGHTPPYRRAPPPPRAKPQRHRLSREVGAAGNDGANGGSKHESDSPRRKPVRPAPQAPGGQRNSSSSSIRRMQSHEEPVSPDMGAFNTTVVSPSDLSQSYPPHPLTGRNRSYSQDGYSTLESDRGGYGTLDSGEHVIVQLTISQSDRDILSPEEGGVPSPAHARSASDPLVMMQQMSNSLPEMLNEAGDSNSPETMEGHAPGPSKIAEGTSNKHSPSNKHSHGNRHTRHLSLMGGSKKDAHEGSSRKKPKRGGSLKQRSRSPPNLPPPPPPPSDPALSSEPGAVSSPEGEAHSPLNTSGRSVASNVSSSGSLGFSEVLRTMSNIDHQLDAIAESYTTTTIITPSQPPGRPPPPPPTDTQMVTLPFAQPNLGPSPIPQSPTSHQCKVPSPVPEENENGDFCEDEWLCDGPPEEDGTAQPLNMQDHTHMNGVLGAGRSTADQKPKKQHHVMFKEEVEAIPNYEPRVDQEDDSGEETAIDDEAAIEELPTGVAAIKMKLFGKREVVATRYKKDGVLSPKNTHPENMTFSEQYFSTDVMDDAGHMNGNGSYEHSVNIVSHQDNANNNNSEKHSEEGQVGSDSAPQPQGESKATPTLEPQEDKKEDKPAIDEQPLSPVLSSDGEKEARKHNVYESPWDEKPISKYKVIGIVRKTASQATSGGRVKDKSPSPAPPKQGNAPTQRMQFAEVSTKETPKPSATELRNVHSLERNLLKKRRQQSPSSTPLQQHVSPPTTSMSGTDDDDSLLASISSTLQATSLYGSDTLLCSELNSSDDKATGVVKITAKGELEKIRTAHRKDDQGITSASSVGSLSGHAQYSSPQLFSAPSSANSTPFRSGARPSGGLAATRMTKSLDGLQNKETEVTYSPHMQAHILRSLV